MSSGSCLISKLYDKIIKMPSKYHENIPLKWRLGGWLAFFSFIFRFLTDEEKQRLLTRSEQERCPITFEEIVVWQF
jgi:hypothetical protein